ncbi:MAG TPA: terminase TerL endonuclease subunit [Xanthobacteraceae bacterium]|nr:terminase TerL endonuclease subunit [Xanthobacteraceae bacterium]
MTLALAQRPLVPPAVRAAQNIKWCQDNLFLPEGKYVGQKFVMAEFMQEDFRAIYGNPNGTRRAIISRGRKNAKSVECAAIVLLHLCGYEYRPNGAIFSCAQSRDQAGIIFDRASKMVRLSPVLRRIVKIKENAKELHCESVGTMYKALSAEKTTAFGLSPVLTIHDELGQVRGPRFPLYEAMETATAAQDEPLTVIISTQAPTDADLLSQLIDDAKTGADPRTVLRFNTASMDSDPFDIDTIRDANPALDVFMNKTEVMAMAEDARRLPSREAEYRNLVLNQRVEASNPFVTPNVWKACGTPVQPFTNTTPIYAGLDLSSVADLTALVMIGQPDTKTWHVHPTFWLPSEGLAEKARNDRVPYDLWAQQGFLETTDGGTIKYEYVAHLLRDLFNRYNIRKLAFDRWNMVHLKPWLEKAGFSVAMIEDRFVEFGQGTQSMSPALRSLEELLRDKLIAHGNHPVLAMCAACAVVDGKDDANRKLSKNKSSGRIDGLVALAMAVGVAQQMRPVDVSTLIG